MKLLKKLPDWMNPVFVKDLRQTFSSKYLLIVSGISLLLEAFFIYQVWKIRKNHILVDQQLTLDFVNYFFLYLQFGIILCAMLMIPLLSRWLSERASDAVSPERVTPLSAGVIIRGKMQAIFAVQLWTLLLWLPFTLYLNSLLSSTVFPKCFLLITGLWFVGQILLSTWSVLIPLISKPQRNSSGISKFIAAFLLVVSSLIMHSVLCILGAPMQRQAQWQGQDTVVKEISPLICDMSVKNLIILFSMIVILIVYGMFLIHSTSASKHANKMFPARLGGLILLGLTSLILYFCDAGSGAIVFFLLSYLTFQFIVQCNDSCLQPVRMKLDAPKNPVLKIFWYFCGTGMMWGWLYNTVLFIGVILILHFTGGEEMLGRILIVDSCFAAIYAAIACWIRLAFHGKFELNGPLLFLAIWFGAIVCTIIFAIFGIKLKILTLLFLIDMLQQADIIHTKELPLPMNLLIFTSIFAICTFFICFLKEARGSKEKGN
ncbi:MAG: hypothetical protein IKM17_09755 [Lentisphaeria bacterium]|nr:hypothetical protein [Lentisphaeria bacterium]